MARTFILFKRNRKLNDFKQGHIEIRFVVYNLFPYEKTRFKRSRRDRDNRLKIVTLSRQRDYNDVDREELTNLRKV